MRRQPMGYEATTCAMRAQFSHLRADYGALRNSAPVRMATALQDAQGG